MRAPMDHAAVNDANANANANADAKANANGGSNVVGLGAIYAHS
jgi:hypothetical protein